MRRRDQEVTDINEIRHILDVSQVLHFGLCREGMPYVIPMNYGYTLENGKLTFYIHGATDGKKLDIIRDNPNCCVQIDCETSMFEGKVACQYGYTYSSLIANGTAVIVEDPEEKMKAMTILMKTLTGKDFEFNERLVSIVSVIRVDCSDFTAKHRPLPETLRPHGKEMEK